MLDARGAKLIKKYYLLPKAAWYSLAALFLTGGVAILLVMIDNIGLGSSGFGDMQAIAMAVLMVIEGAACIAFGIAARRGLGSERWQELEREAMGANADIDSNPALAGGIGMAAAGRLVDTLDNDDLDALSTGLEVAGAAMATYGFFDTMRRMSKAAAAVAHVHGLELPGLGRTRLLVMGLPLLLLTLAFVPRFMDSAALASASQEASTRTIQAFDTALEPVCGYTLADEPLEHRQDSGYRVSGNITDENDDAAASVAIETDELGAVDSVAYNADVDIARTPEENLAFAEECFARFHEALASVDIEAEGIELLDAGLVQKPVLPEEFRQAFLTGDYYTALDVDLDDTGTLRAWALFDTEPQAEFDEYTRPRISIYLMAKSY
ncbi:hypothetical protein E4J93_06120 [Collinsella sp. BA40]|uniref:hypothetical protein n=1 Tax=Collinsella sp. BA40 TaxID=2560852 RepID=UPI0011CBBD65|nr:hypothetical protein [Collinsella sp. BA40]TXF35991.1 hypothetical protein E4J93_06120 [Collinsella sp. BA40]